MRATKINKNSKIYISGHSGFVGSNLKYELERRGFSNVIVRKKLCINLLDCDDVDYFFKSEEPEYVFNCSAIVGGIKANIENPYKFLFENLQIQNNLINSSIKYGVKKFLNLGSSCIYPKDFRQPLTEEDLLASKLEPTNEGYSLAKICGLKLCEYANKQSLGTNFISLMPCNLYGPGDHFDSENSHALASIVSRVCKAKKNGDKKIIIWGTGEAKREWMFIDDLIDGIIWATESLDKTDTFLNIGTGIDISMIDLTKEICSIIDYKGEVGLDTTKPNGMMRKCLDVSKINMLGWKSKINLKDGLVKTIEYYLKNNGA